MLFDKIKDVPNEELEEMKVTLKKKIIYVAVSFCCKRFQDVVIVIYNQTLTEVN